MQPCRLELVADQAEAQKPGAEGVLLVAGTGLFFTSRALGQRLVADRQAKLDVSLHLAGVGERGVEHPELNRTLLKYRM